MTREERRGFGNGVWLCANCAILVDRDTELYSAEVLRNWKLSAEDQARRELGKRLAEPSDAIEQLATIFTGSAPKFIPQAIGNVHAAAAANLARLDPRFHVESAFQSGAARFRLFAQEPVALSVQVDGQSAAAWAQGMSQVLELGRSAVLPMSGVTFVGSKLLEAMQDLAAPDGSLTITPIGKGAALKLLMPDADGSPLAEELRGTLVAGRNAMHFEGNGFGGVVKIEMDLERTKEESTRGSLSVVFGFSAWEGLDVRQAPFLEKIYRLLRCLVNEPEKLLAHLEIEGEHVLTGKNVQMGDSEHFAYLLNFVAYARRARTVARAMSNPVPIDVDRPFSVAEHTALADAADIFEGKKRYDRECLTEGPSFTLVGNEDELRALTERETFEPLQMRFSTKDIMVFGRPVELPLMEVKLNCVRLHLKASKAIDAGMEFEIEAEMGPDFMCEYGFVQEADQSSHGIDVEPSAR